VDLDRPDRRATAPHEVTMSITRTLATDRTGLLGAGAGMLAQLPPEALYGYILARILIPVLLIVYATRGATPAQRIALVTAYLTGSSRRPSGRT
jgi:hypothetical protein